MRLRTIALMTALVVIGLQLAAGTASAGFKTVHFSSSTFAKIESGTSIQITVEVSGGSVSSPSTVDYATSDGSAAAGSDYTARSGTLAFPTGSSSKTFTVPLTNDPTYEGDQTFTITLSNATGNFIMGTPSTTTVTIEDDDVFVNVSTEWVAPSVGEGDGSVTISVGLTDTAAGENTAMADHDVTFNYATGGGSATAGSDYSSVSGTETIPAGGTMPVTISIPIVDDSSSESSQTFRLTLSSVVGGQLGSRSVATITITDNDSSGQTLAFSATGTTVAEGAGSVTLTVVRSGGTTGTATVGYSTGDGTATSGTDYTGASGTLTFTAGQSTKTITVALTSDTSTESNETFTVTLSSPTNATLGSPSSSTVTIVDDDGTAAVLGFSSSVYSVTESGTQVTITVTRSGSASGSKSVDYTTTDGTATSGSDYTTAAGTLTFASSDTSKTFDVLITDDAAVEGDETVTLTLSGPTGGAVLGTSTSTLTITDDDESTVETHDRSVSLKLRRHLKAKGTVTVADGTADCYKKVTVKIQRKRSGVWKTIDSTVTDNQGDYRTAIPDKKGRYRAKVKSLTLDNGDICSSDKSGTKRHRH